MNFEKGFVEPLGSWGDILKPFIVSPDCDEIYRQLRELKVAGKKITPVPEQLYRAFKECPYEDLKCVFILQDPYKNVIDGVRVADGIPMSCSNTGILQPSLKQWYDGIEDGIYGGLALDMDRDPDLTYLANQGVLLLNIALTTEIGESKAHIDLGIWNKFTEYTLKMLNLAHKGMIFVFIGSPAQEYNWIIDGKSNIKINLEHPAYAARQNRKWLHQKVFTTINEALHKDIKETILWDLGPCPF